MPSGLVALLDDIAGLTKLAAASLDDVGAAAAKAGTKAAGVVVDDTAVTPNYVVGLDPKRELPIIWRIAKGSLRNKLILLIPAALLLSAFAPWAITPLLMIGGLFLCFEGAEKIIEKFGGGHAGDDEPAPTDPKQLEDRKVAGAVRTDLILSAEIVAITLADVAASPLVQQGVVLAVVGVGITAAVYGVVALIVKLDDIGLHFAGRGPGWLRAFGRGLVVGVPRLMTFLSVVGTAAMLWVGGQIVTHGAEGLGFAAPAHLIDGAAHGVGGAIGIVPAAVEWVVSAALNGLVGLALGAIIALIVGRFHRARHRPRPNLS